MTEHNGTEPGFQGGVVESETPGVGPVQSLPVWASTEPYGYGGDVADQQVVGGRDVLEDADSAIAEREIIGTDGD